MHMLIAIVLLFVVYSIEGRARRSARRRGRRGARRAARPPTPASRRGDVVLERRRRRGRRRRRARRGGAQPSSRATSVTVVVDRDGARQTIAVVARHATRPRTTRTVGTALLGVEHVAASRSEHVDRARRGRQLERHRPLPDRVGATQGRRQGAQPGQHRQPPDRHERRSRDTPDDARRRHAVSGTIGDAGGHLRGALPARRAQRVRRRVQHVPAAAARRWPCGDRRVRAGPRARRPARYFADVVEADAVRDGRDRRARCSCSCPACTSTSPDRSR